MQDTSVLLLEELLPGGGQWSGVLKRGQSLRLTDIDGGANVALLAFNAHEKSERLNLPDTLKAQHTARITAGHCIYSDMGRVLLAVTHDEVGWHDPLGGLSLAMDVAAKYGPGRYQELRNAYHRSSHDNLVVELGKWGMSAADLVMNLNLFSRVDCNNEGELIFKTGHSLPGASIELYAPMDTLLLLTALQHPLDPHPEYCPKPVQLALRRDPAQLQQVAACRALCPENGRGFELTERLYL